MVTIGNLLNSRLVFHNGWTRNDFVCMLCCQLQDAGNYYLDSKTSNYEAEEGGDSFAEYCNELEDGIYECLLDLEIDEIDYTEFSWDMSEWYPQENSYSINESYLMKPFEENEIDLILDRDIE